MCLCVCVSFSPPPSPSISLSDSSSAAAWRINHFRDVRLQLREQSLWEAAGRQHGWGWTSSRSLGMPDWAAEGGQVSLGFLAGSVVWDMEERLGSQERQLLRLPGCRGSAGFCWGGKRWGTEETGSPSWGWGWRGGTAKEGQFHQAGMSEIWGGAGGSLDAGWLYSQGQGSK